MGTDNLFHKRKAAARDLQRKKPSRERYDKVLIVCEGSKTEPLYFTDLKDHYEIDTANIRISGDCGSAPLTVVNHGEELFRREQRECGEPFDKVYFVFDRDQHESYLAAISKIEKLKPSGTFIAIPSTPCFEIWLLLHFKYISAAFNSNGGKSSGALVLEELEKFWPNYKKGSSGAFKYLIDNIEMAKAFAVRLEAESLKTGSENPLTKVHELVTYLQKIKEPKTKTP